MDSKQLGERISNARKKLHYTQRELAERLNISDKTISKWERGVGCPDISLLLPLCEQLHIEVSELLGKESKEGNEVKEGIEEEQKLRQFIEYAKLRAIENKAHILKMTTSVISVLSLLAIGICLLVNYVMDTKFTWSMVVAVSILYGYSILITLLLSLKHRVEKTLFVITILLFPFLCSLSWQKDLIMYFPMAYAIAGGAVLLVWLIYLVVRKLRMNIYFKLSLIILLSSFNNLFVYWITKMATAQVYGLLLGNIIGVVLLFIAGCIRYRKKHI